MLRSLIKKPIILILLLSIIFRLYILVEFTDLSACCISDQGIYNGLAKNLIGGKGFVVTKADHPNIWTEPIYGVKPPLYPYFLASIYKMTRPNVVIAYLAQILISTITGYLIFLTAKLCFSKQTGLIALIIYAFFWETAIMPTILLSENIFWLLISLLAYLLIREKQLSIKTAIITGIVLGLLTLVRPPSLTMIIPISVWLLFRNMKVKTLLPILVMGIFCLLTLIPWTIRNYQIYNKFVFIYTDGGINAWMGNFPGTGGTYHIPDPKNPNQTPILHSTGPLKEVERDNFYSSLAFNYIIRHPWDSIDMSFVKLFQTFSSYRQFILNTTRVRTNWPLSRPNSKALDALLGFIVSYEFAGVILFFIISIIFVIKNRSLLTAPVYLVLILTSWHILSIMATHYEPRYVMQIYTLIIPIAALSLTCLINSIPKTKK